MPNEWMNTDSRDYLKGMSDSDRELYIQRLVEEDQKYQEELANESIPEEIPVQQEEPPADTGPGDKVNFKLTGKKRIEEAPNPSRMPQSEDYNPGYDAYLTEDAEPVGYEGEEGIATASDELTDEQINQLEASSGVPAPQIVVPDEMSEEEMNLVLEHGPTALSGPDELTDEQMQSLLVAQTLSGAHSEKLLKDLGAGPVSAASAANTLAAAGEFYDKKSGWLAKTFYALTVPEQFMARQATNLLENMNLMETQEAKDILARDEVHGSDLVDFYWRNPQGWMERGARFMTGLAADIIIDPLSYIGVGVLTKAAKTATVAGKTINNLGKFSTAERKWFKTVETVENIITKEGLLVKPEKGVYSAQQAASKTKIEIAKLRDKEIGFDDLVTNLGAGPEAKAELTKTFQEGLTKKSWVKEWHEGDRGLNIGFNIPFTRTGVEFDLPSIINKPVGTALKGLGWAFDLPRKAMVQTKFGTAMWQVFSDLSTRSGKFLFDVQQNARMGAMEARKSLVQDFERSGRETMKGIEKQIGSQSEFNSLIDDFVEELEFRPLSKKEAIAAAEAHQVAPKIGFDFVEGPVRFRGESINPKVYELTKPSGRDAERAARLAKYPQLEGILNEAIDLNSAMVEEYSKRGIPFTELNPFGPGWAKRYVKHMVTNDWFDVMKKNSKGADDIAQALDYVASKVGKVDPSALGRKYRGGIREANTASMEELGVKVFVDDPFELISRRALEMEKVIQNHDLMEAASAYAVKGKSPGANWVKFDWNHFGNLVLDESTDTFDKWRAFVPEYYKQADNIYLPYDVYDRMLFSINGYELGPKSKAIFQAADAYTQLWRNNALFGPGYQGLNAMSNITTYLSFNGLGGIPALSDATQVMFGSKNKVFDLVNPDGSKYVMNAEELLAEALEDNILRSGNFSDINFGNLAEHVSSNRESAKKGFMSKAKTVADYAFLWRLNRHVSETADAIPKIATYLHRRQAGFSRDAARELSERYFYNFNMGPKGMDAISKFIPFSRFPMKTLEMVIDEVRSGHLGALTIPGKVSASLEGAFVPSQEVRQALDETIPAYSLIKHPIHGQIMPGQREVLVDLPWASTTIDMIFNPTESLHPIAQIFNTIGSYYSASDDIKEAQGDSLFKLFQTNVDMIIPSYMREAMAIWDINTGDLGGYYADRYKEELPLAREQDDLFSDKEQMIGVNSRAQKFSNSVEFGTAMAKKYSDNWLYNLVFYNNPDIKPGLIKDQTTGAQGEYIRRKFRQLSFGAATLTKLDSNFIFNHYAIQRQIKNKKDSLTRDLYGAEELMVAGQLDNEQYLEKLSESRPDAKELLALTYKQQALSEYYDFFLGLAHKDPTVNPVEVIFGVDDSKMDTANAPALYDQLTIKASKVTDAEADEAQTLLMMGD